MRQNFWAYLGLRVRRLTGVRERVRRGLGLRLLRPLPATATLVSPAPAVMPFTAAKSMWSRTTEIKLMAHCNSR